MTRFTSAHIVDTIPLPALTGLPRKDIAGKTCQAPSCGATFFRKEGETITEFERRRTCGGKCHREFQGFLRSKRAEAAAKGQENYAWIASDEITCSNCANWDEDEICEGCNGQYFRSKRRKG